MSYIATALVVLGFLIAAFVQIAVATKSLRNSWYLSLTFLTITAGIVVVFVSQALDDKDRRNRLMVSLLRPSGAPVQINDTTSLISVSQKGAYLIYDYEILDNAELPSQAQAITQNCTQPELRALLELGATIKHNFESKSGSTHVIELTRTLCD